MVADKLFKDSLSFKLKILIAAIAVVGLLVPVPQARAQLLTPEQVAARQASFPAPWPTLTQTASPNPATVGQPLTFTVSVTNNSSYQGVRVSGLLPEGSTLASPPTQSTPNGGCSVSSAQFFTGDISSQYFLCSLSPIPAGELATATISVIPTTPGAITNIVQDFFGQQVQTTVTVLSPTEAPTALPSSGGGIPPYIMIPPYIVQPGDTLSEIAERFGTSVEAIAQANGIDNPHLIFPGQSLRIPSA